MSTKKGIDCERYLFWNELACKRVDLFEIPLTRNPCCNSGMSCRVSFYYHETNPFFHWTCKPVCVDWRVGFGRLGCVVPCIHPCQRQGQPRYPPSVVQCSTFSWPARNIPWAYPVYAHELLLLVDELVVAWYNGVPVPTDASLPIFWRSVPCPNDSRGEWLVHCWQCLPQLR